MLEYSLTDETLKDSVLHKNALPHLLNQKQIGELPGNCLKAQAAEWMEGKSIGNSVYDRNSPGAK